MSPSADAAFVEVRILALPVQIWARAQEHTDGLLREFALLAVGTDHQAHVPRRLLDLVQELERDYAGLASNQSQELARAAGCGADAVDLAYLVPPDVAGACTRLGQALDQADQYCRSGEHLLSLAAPPEALAFRRWYLDEFMAQVAGGPPTPWPVWAAGTPGAATSYPSVGPDA